jgi:hypothetical protein
MKRMRWLIAGAAILLTTALQAQTVDEILNKHVEAIGGKETLGKVKSIYTEISMEVMGNSAPSIEYLLAGKGFKSETDFNGSKIINCLTDKGGWTVNPMAGGTDPQPMPDALYKSNKDGIYVGGALVDYAIKGYKAELAVKEGNDFKIKISGDGVEAFYFIDPVTYNLTKVTSKSEVMGQTVDVTTTFSDFKKTDFGIVLPYTRNVDLGMFQLAQTVNKVEINKEIDPKIFEMSK